MIAIPQIQVMETQTPRGKRVVKIIRAPNVINLQKRGTLIATRWLASSPYAKYQEIMNEMNREYLRKLAEYSQQMKRWKMEMENYTATQIKQLKQKYDEMLKERLREYAKLNADLLFVQMVNSGVNTSKAKEIVLDFLTRSYVPFSEASDIVVRLEEKYKPKITPPAPSPTSSYSGGGGGGGSRRKTSTSSGSTYTPTTPSTPTDISSKIEKVNEAAEKASSTGYREVPTNVPGVTAVVDESGNITGYHDYVRGVCTIEPPKPTFEYYNPFTNPYYSPYTCPVYPYI